MEQENTINTNKQRLKLGFTYKELGAFLLLFFLTLKFTVIVILHSRSIVIDFIVYGLFVATFNYSNWTYKSLFQTGLVIGIYTLINFSPYKLNVLMPLLIIQTVSGISFKRYLTINFIISGVFLLLMYIINGEGYNMAGFNFMVDRKTRMSFGFNHPNVAALSYYLFIVNGLLLMYFSKFKKQIPLYLLLIIPLWFYIYKMTASRSFLLSIVILYGSYFYFSIGKRINKENRFKVTSYIYIALPFLFSAMTLFFSYFREEFGILDRILSKRLTFYSWYLDTLNPMAVFFGSDTYEDFVIDSSYLHLLFEGGIFFFIGYCLFYVISTINMVNNKAWVPTCVIMSFMAYGLMESMLLYSMLIGTNIYWITLYFYYKNGKMKL